MYRKSRRFPYPLSTLKAPFFLWKNGTIDTHTLITNFRTGAGNLTNGSYLVNFSIKSQKLSIFNPYRSAMVRQGNAETKRIREDFNNDL